MQHLIRFGAALLTILALFGLDNSGMLASLDSRLSEWRLAAGARPVSGSTVVVEIDSRSLSEIGVWPWPRSLHASLLDRLMDAGADEVAFDIDFSSARDTFDDAIFTAALERAGGYAYLATFVQTGQDGAMHFSRPLPQFAAAADSVHVNVLLDPVTGLAQEFPTAIVETDGSTPSLALALAPQHDQLPALVEIDYSLDLAAIPRLSFTDVLYGRVDPAQLQGKQIIVGASAIELRDFFSVPRFGVISGPMLQAMALETLKSGRILTSLGARPSIILVSALALALLLFGRRLTIPATGLLLMTLALAAEIGAAMAYARFGLMLDTASLHVGLLFLLGLAIADNGYRHLRARRAAQQRLQYLATHDPPTGLLSQQGLFALPQPVGSQCLILLEVQSVDELRATLGHEVIEAVLRQFSHRLLHSGGCDIARISTARFALRRADNGDADDLKQAAYDLCTSLSGSYQSEGHHLHLELVAGYTSGSETRMVLLNQAEIALIQARTDRVRARSFSPADHNVLERHRRLDRDLRLALGRNQLRLVFQPKIDLKTRQIMGVEALMRWEHPDLGLISPVEFIPLAEETGLIVDLGRWIMHEACVQATTWQKPISVAVNVSPVQFQKSDVVAVVESALRSSRLPSSRLELEITESSRVSDATRVHDAMWQLQDMGVRLSIDDFGTGYSTLSYFRDLPFHTVKIDQSFVRDRTSAQDRKLLAAIIRLANTMGKATVAEGVEDADAANMLTRLGCTYGQGYHFGRPISSEDIATLLGAVPGRRQQA